MMHFLTWSRRKRVSLLSFLAAVVSIVFMGHAAAWGGQTNAPPTNLPLDAVVVRPVYSGTSQIAMRQIFYVNGFAYSRDSSDAAGTVWPTTWAVPASYAASWGGQTNAPPTNLALDTVVIRPVYSGTTQIAMKQIFYVNGMAYSRQSIDFGGANWPTIWAAPASYAASWGSDLNHPPTDHLDSVVIRPIYSGTTQIAMRQIFYANGVAYSRDSSDAAGTVWPATWASASYTAAWGGQVNAPPTNLPLDAVVIRPVYSGTTQIAMKQIFYVNGFVYSRQSTDFAGTSWPTTWAVPVSYAAA